MTRESRMRRRHWSFRLSRAALLFGLALGWASGSAQAADCRGADRWPVEKTVCADDTLRALDRRVDAAAEKLSEASWTDANAVERDQANWRANTVAAGWAALSADDNAEQRLAPRYRSRLAHLRRRLQHVASNAPPIDRIQRDLESGDWPTGAGLADGLARVDPAISRIMETGNVEDHFDSAEAVFKTLNLAPDAGLRERVPQQLGNDGRVRLFWDAGQRVGAIYAIEGTAHCFYGAWFAAGENGAAHAIDAPSIVTPENGGEPDTACGSSRIDWLRIDGHTYAARIDSNTVDQTTLSLQRRVDDTWQSEQRVVARFDHELGDVNVICRSKTYCGLWVQVAKPLAEAFDRRPEPGFNAPALAPRQIDGFRHMRALARSADKNGPTYTPAPRIQPGRDSPIAPYDQFAPSAVYFPLSVGHHWILGRIGRAHLGWRTRDDWLIGFWDLPEDSDQLVPMATVRIGVHRTGTLGSAVMSRAD